MNTRLLRMAHRDRCGRCVYGNPVSLLPPSGTGAMAWGRRGHWSGRDAKGEYVRSVDLNRHLKLAKQEIRKLLEETKTLTYYVNRVRRDLRRKGYNNDLTETEPFREPERNE